MIPSELKFTGHLNGIVLTDSEITKHGINNSHVMVERFSCFRSQLQTQSSYLGNSAVQATN